VADHVRQVQQFAAGRHRLITGTGGGRHEFHTLSPSVKRNYD
jgi:hypothetical protein